MQSWNYMHESTTWIIPWWLQSQDDALHSQTAHQITISFSQRRKQKWPSSTCSAYKPLQPSRSRGGSSLNSQNSKCKLASASPTRLGRQGSRLQWAWNSPPPKRGYLEGWGYVRERKKAHLTGEIRIKKERRGSRREWVGHLVNACPRGEDRTASSTQRPE